MRSHAFDQLEDYVRDRDVLRPLLVECRADLAEIRRLRAALVRISQMNCGPDQGSPTNRTEWAAAFAQATLAATDLPSRSEAISSPELSAEIKE